MIKLHEDLQAINAQLLGIAVTARGQDYVFHALELDALREPPVADGYVFHPILRVSVWRWEFSQHPSGEVYKVRARYSFRPADVTIRATRIEDGDSK